MWWDSFVGWTIAEAGGSDQAIAWMLLRAPDGERALVVARTYRGGPRVAFDVTDAELATCREDAWRLWNGDRLKP
jgi:hypothetical protein